MGSRPLGWGGGVPDARRLWQVLNAPENDVPVMGALFL